MLSWCKRHPRLSLFVGVFVVAWIGYWIMRGHHDFILECVGDTPATCTKEYGSLKQNLFTTTYIALCMALVSLFALGIVRYIEKFAAPLKVPRS